MNRESEREPQMAQIDADETGKMTSEVSERDPQTYAIIGAAMEVHSVLGCGFLNHIRGRESFFLLWRPQRD